MLTIWCAQVTVRLGTLPTEGEKGDRFKVLLLPLADDAYRAAGSERRDSQRASELWAASDEIEAEVFKVRVSFTAEPKPLMSRISEEGSNSLRSPVTSPTPDGAARAHFSHPSPPRAPARTASLPLPLEEPSGLGLRRRRGYTLAD